MRLNELNDLPVDVGETVGVVRSDGDLHHNSSAVVDHGR